MSLKFSLLSILLIAFACRATAQYDLESSDTSKNRIKVHEEKNPEQKRSEMTETPNMIKFNVYHVANGEFLFSYERMFNKYFSAEAAAGPTYFSPLLLTYSVDMLIGDIAQYDILGQAEVSNSGVGTSLRLGGRFYPVGEDFPEAWFISLEGRTRWYNQILDMNKYASMDALANLKQTYSELYLLGGYQSEASEPFYYEYNFGVGMRKRNLQYAEMGHLPNGDPTYEVKNYQSKYPFVTTSFKVGIAF